tara:strand:- start:2618 stop:3097 length:480 start_codon:yes stop_codon:yes gene_type:complete
MTLGQAALHIAENEIGNGEEGRNNRGFDINRYRRGRTPISSGSWCATFIYYCLEEGWCGLRKRMKHFPFNYTASAAKLAMQLQRHGALVEFNDMRPGDILLFDRRGGKHINIVKQTVHDQENVLSMYVTIDGNKGAFPAKVAEFNHCLYPRPLKVIRLP